MGNLQKKKQLNLNHVYTYQETNVCWSCLGCALNSPLMTYLGVTGFLIG